MSLPRFAGALAVLLAAVAGTTGHQAAVRPAETPPVRALLVIGGCCHDYFKQQELVTKGVSARANVSWARCRRCRAGTRPFSRAM